jgi:hypothetical protein
MAWEIAKARSALLALAHYVRLKRYRFTLAGSRRGDPATRQEYSQ